MTPAIETTIYIAASIVFTFYIHNVSVLLLCLFHRVRVETFQIFYTVKDVFISNFKINNTHFRVGIFPINCNLKIYGMQDDLITVQTINDAMLISKPKYIQRFIVLFPILTQTLCLFILLFLINDSKTIFQNFKDVLDSLVLIYEMAIGTHNSQEALLNWLGLKENNNVFALVLSVVLLQSILSTTLGAIMYSITQKVSNKYPKILLVILLLLIIVVFVLVYTFAKTAIQIHNELDAFFLIIIFSITSYLVAVILIQTLKILPKQKFV